VYVVAEVHPDVAAVLEGDAVWRQSLEQATGKRVLILPRPGIHLDRAVIRQADTPDAAERQAAQGDGAGAAMWLDPIRGETLQVPDDDTVDVRMLRPVEAARPGTLARFWDWLLGRRTAPPAAPAPSLETAPVMLPSRDEPFRPRRRGRGRRGRSGSPAGPRRDARGGSQ
jgi:hypothetical protein